MALPEQGVAVLNCLAVEPSFRGHPLVLVGHSMGGLVIKHALVHADTHDDARLKRVLEDVCLTVFVATPHQGSSLANLAKAAKWVLGTNPQVGDMRRNDVDLKNLTGQFRNLQAGEASFAVQAFFETHPVRPTSRLDRFFMPWARVQVVDRNSGDPNIPGVSPVPVPADHFQIAKPKSHDADVHKTLLQFIADALTAKPASARPRSQPASPTRHRLRFVHSPRHAVPASTARMTIA